MKYELKQNFIPLPLYIAIFLLYLNNCFAQNNLEKKFNLQSNTSISSTRGNAFGESTRRQILNNFSELPISDLSSIGEIIQFSHVKSSYKNNTERDSLNSAEFEIAYRYRFNNPFDEIRQRFYLGTKLNQKFSFLLQQDLSWAVTARETPTRNSPRQMQNFQFSKNFYNIITPRLIYKIDRDNAVQIAYFKRLGGNDLQHDSAGFSLGLLNSF